MFGTEAGVVRRLHLQLTLVSLTCLIGLSSLHAADPAMPAEPAVPANAEQPPCAPGSTPAVLPIDLPAVLRLINASNPTIAVAQARVEEAYYDLRKAQVAWLPDLNTGPAYYRHDGQIQNSLGNVFTTSKSNFFEGGGAYLTWDATDLYFAPLVARRLYQAQAAAAQAVTNDEQLDAVLTYLDLVRVYAALAVNADTLARAEEMLNFAKQAAEGGIGPTSIVPRAQTEVDVRRAERIDLMGEVGVVSARLAQLLLLEPATQLQPAEPPVVPVTLVPPDGPLDKLIAVALDSRPEMHQSQALVGAARARYRQAVVSPFLPKLEVGYEAGTFGGGRDSFMGNFDGRSDGTAMAVWELHNLGLGDLNAARARRSQVAQANYHVTEIQAQVGAEVVSAASVSAARLRAVPTAEDAVGQGIEMWARLRRFVTEVGPPARQYNPLDLLIAEQQLNQARVLYLNQVIDYNKSQFRLYWAMGQPPLCALPQATPVLVKQPVVPPPYEAPKTTEKLPQPRPAEDEKKGDK